MSLMRTTCWISFGFVLAVTGAHAQEQVNSSQVDSGKSGIATQGGKPGALRGRKNDLLLRDAERLLKAGKYADALALLESVESVRSGEVRFDYLLGVASLDAGKADKAVQAFGRVLAAAPDFDGARLDMARAYYQVDDLTRAKASFEEVLKHDPPAKVRSTIQKYLDKIAAQTTTSHSPVIADQGQAVGQQDGNPDNNGNTPLVRIERFRVVGNTLLDDGMVQQLLAPYLGEAKSFTDIQRALEALEEAYRKAGYSAVSIITPEQEIAAGEITFIVTEAVIGKVIISGNQHYDEDNIRNALPALEEGASPSVRKLSENLRLANQNPTRQTDVILALSDEEGKVDAKVNVEDESPHKFFATFDNTGNQSTGQYRAGIGYQHNNLLNRDHAATLNYVTSPDHVRQVTQLSASYRLPLYALGDSIDLIAAYSDTDAGTTSTVAGPLSFSGQGKILSARYNFYLPRKGEYSSKITAGIDYRAYVNNCTLGAFGAAGCGAAAADVTVHPVSISYEGTWTTPAYVADYSLSLVRNIPGGARGGSADVAAARPSPVGGAGARGDYSLLRFTGNLAGALPDNWQYRLTGNAQYTPSALISGESFGLAGSTAVRGFLEREFSSDKGYVLNLELYTPELAPKLDFEDSSVRLLGFADHARGWKVPLAGELPESISLGSIGLGLRWSYGKNLMLKADLARVVDTAGTVSRGRSRGQIGVVLTW
ncbi:MAG TPA: ShlB/FhaC/HecB family hemolysin secretion/activation protein [Gallionella sp.]|nr:ShlB/FhaC/HecB family hemolysin secretion/activation protein [Gallionella sp.]